MGGYWTLDTSRDAADFGMVEREDEGMADAQTTPLFAQSPLGMLGVGGCCSGLGAGAAAADGSGGLCGGFDCVEFCGSEFAPLDRKDGYASYVAGSLEVSVPRVSSRDARVAYSSPPRSTSWKRSRELHVPSTVRGGSVAASSGYTLDGPGSED